MVFYGFVDNHNNEFVKFKIIADTAKDAYGQLELLREQVENTRDDFRGNVINLKLEAENYELICESNFDDVPKCLAAFDKLMEVKEILDNGFVVPEDIGFECGGQWILNPFYDETLRFKLRDPYEYYGRETIGCFLDNVLSEFAKSNKKLSVEETLAEAVERSRVADTSVSKDTGFIKE